MNNTIKTIKENKKLHGNAYKYINKTYLDAKWDRIFNNCNYNNTVFILYNINHAFYENGNKECEVYLVDRKQHRPVELGPAQTKWYYNGNKECEIYLVNRKQHRPIELGPALTHWGANGNKDCEQYWVNGKKHRPVEIGPACTQWYNNGNKECEQYWVDGVRQTHLDKTYP
jgi:hypothetical protein